MTIPDAPTADVARRSGAGPCATLLTPPGTAALAVVGVAGAGAAAAVDALFASRAGRPIAPRPDNAVCVGRWGPSHGPAEELVVVRHGAERLEVHCHGGVAASAAVLEGLGEQGVEIVSWQDWLVRTGEGGVALEARVALATVGGAKAAQILARQLSGALDEALMRIDALRAAGDVAAVAAMTDRLLRAARVGLRLARPWRVVLAGAVNAGKSSLVNALAGHARSIVSAVPGTTRDVIETRLVIDGWEVDLVDTAGLCAADPADDQRYDEADEIERAGIARAAAVRAAADLVLRVVPVGSALPAPAEPGPPELVIVSKCDLASEGPTPGREVIVTSAVTGAGIDALASRIVAALVPEERDDPRLLAGAVPFTARQVALVEDARYA